MPGTQLTRRMTAQDAWFLYFETPDAPLHIGSVGIFEGQLEYDKLVASMSSRMHLIPRYRQKAVTPPFFAGHPTWEDDPSFSVERHLRRVRLPAPGNEAQLMDVVCSELWTEMLPRDRPLWDITLIEGLEGDRSAFLSRVHHCLVDGVSGIELLLATLDLTPNPEPTPPPAEPWTPSPPPSPLQAWSDAISDQWAAGLRSLSESQQNLLDARAQFRALTDFTRAITATVPAAFRRPAQTNWNQRISRKRRASWTGMSFQEVRGIRSRIGGTVNDVVLTILSGALGRYLQEHNYNVKDAKVRFMIPVNVRREAEKGALGNRVSMMLPEIPIGITSAVERLQAVRDEMERLKSGEQAGAFDAMRRFADNLPAAFHALAGMGGVPAGQVNLVCTNVPGPLIPLYSVGHRMLAHYPMVPLAGDLGIGVGVTSYDKGLFMGVMSDPTLLGDVERIRDLIDDEFRVLRYMADVPVSDLPDFAGARETNGRKASSVDPVEEEPVRSPEQVASGAPADGGV